MNLQKNLYGEYPMKTYNNRNILMLLILLFFLVGLFGCKEDSNPIVGNDFISASAVISPLSGGQVALKTDQGDSVYLIFPKYAVPNPTQIRIEILKDVLPNPFGNNLIPTIRILPDGLKLTEPADLKVKFFNPQTDTSQIVLYYLKQSDLAFPLKKTSCSDNTIRAKIFHFSYYGGAAPTKGEIEGQSDKMKTSSGFDPMDWQGFSQFVQAMLQYIEMLQMLGEDDKANDLLNNLEQRIVEQVNAFLDLPIPNDPCGEYQLALFKYGEMVQLITSNNQLIERVADRINEIRNRCAIRGQLEYDHDFTYLVSGGTIHRKITAMIPFYVNTIHQPFGEIVGEGQGSWDGLVSDVCTGYETLIGSVSLSGELTADSSGLAWLIFNTNEVWSGSVTAVCPNGTKTFPMNTGAQFDDLRFRPENGYTVIRPVPGASGNYKWILHLQLQP